MSAAISATKISQNNDIYISTSAEDELSTSAGSSDNEAFAISGDEESPPCFTPGRALAPPPGLSRRALAPPPGLCLDHGGHLLPMSQQHIRPPPGLEGFSRPPGVFFCRDPAPTGTARGIHSKRPKQVSAVKVGKQTDASPPVCKQTLPTGTTPPVLSGRPAQKPMPPPVLREFDQAIYRKELSDLLRELANSTNDTNVAACVRRVRIQNVPKERQAGEFSDILTRAAEESRGIARRLSFAFAAGLAAGGPSSAFDVEECARGLEFFFLEVFEDLAAEVPRLRNKIANELAPTLRAVFSEEQLARLVPPDCRPVLH